VTDYVGTVPAVVVGSAVERAEPLTDEELRRFVAAYETIVAGAATAVLIGSLTAGAPIKFYRDLLARTPCPTIVDASGPEMLAALEGRPLLVKPNRDELGCSLGRAMDSGEALHQAMAELRARGAVWVVRHRAQWIEHRAAGGGHHQPEQCAQGVLERVGLRVGAGLAFHRHLDALVRLLVAEGLDHGEQAQRHRTACRFYGRERAMPALMETELRPTRKRGFR
jgi:hypothetical protein